MVLKFLKFLMVTVVEPGDPVVEDMTNRRSPIVLFEHDQVLGEWWCSNNAIIFFEHDRALLSRVCIHHNEVRGWHNAAHSGMN